MTEAATKEPEGQEEKGRFSYGCQTVCNDGDIYPAMKELVEVDKLSIKAAARFVHEDSGKLVTFERARMVYRQRRKTPRVGGEVTQPPHEKEKESCEPKEPTPEEAGQLKVWEGFVAVHDEIKDEINAGIEVLLESVQSGYEGLVGNVIDYLNENPLIDPAAMDNKKGHAIKQLLALIEGEVEFSAVAGHGITDKKVAFYLTQQAFDIAPDVKLKRKLNAVIREFAKFKWP